MRLRIVNWREYQHYGQRNPPWVKLHNALLTSRTWVSLDDAGRVLAIASMLLASRDGEGDGSFDADPDFVRRVAYLNQPPDWSRLVALQFVESVDGQPLPVPPAPLSQNQRQISETESASKLLASASARKRSAAVPPPPFESEAFKTAWNLWESYRREIKKPIPATTVTLQYAMLAKWGEAKAIQALENSVRNRWSGLFDPDKNTPSMPGISAPRDGLALGQKHYESTPLQIQGVP